MNLVFQPKDIDQLNGYKNKTHIYTVNKETHYRSGDIQTENEVIKKLYSMQMERKLEQQYPYQIKQTKNFARDKKSAKLLRKYNNYKYICTQPQYIRQIFTDKQRNCQ